MTCHIACICAFSHWCEWGCASSNYCSQQMTCCSVSNCNSWSHCGSACGSEARLCLQMSSDTSHKMLLWTSLIPASCVFQISAVTERNYKKKGNSNKSLSLSQTLQIQSNTWPFQVLDCQMNGGRPAVDKKVLPFMGKVKFLILCQEIGICSSCEIGRFKIKICKARNLKVCDARFETYIHGIRREIF